MNKQQIIDAYNNFVIKYKKHPTRTEINNFAEITRDIVRDRFGNYENLRKEVIKSGIIDKYIFDIETLDETYIKTSKKEISKYKKFVITTAVANSKVNKEFLASLKGYCKHEKAALLILPSLMAKSGPKWNLDVSLKNELVVVFD